MFGLILIMFKDKLEAAGDPGLKTVVKGRYFFALMGFFACYAGLLYNEFFSFPMNLFGTCYGKTPMPLDDQFLYTYTFDNNTEFLVNCSAWGYPREAKNDDGNFCVYPFGMDPVWKLSEYDIQEFNGVKMKLSVILGVMLMELGIICKMVNAKYRGSTIEMIEAIAMFLMLFLLFGMMDILIFAKWLYPTNIDATAESVTFHKEYFDADESLLTSAPCVPSTDDVMGSYTFVASQEQITVNAEP
jgi:V-type H+-transporting ATPase subunit a